MINQTRPTAMTGDRPTGQLHLGHYVGSLRLRKELQETHHLTVLVADLQALTDNAGNPQKITDHIPEVMLDYLAVGLDPDRCTFVLQSAVPELAELTGLLMNLTTVAALERNPTVRSEITMRGFSRDIPAGFFCYPIAQAADIIGLGSGVIPVGSDQMPMVELANELIDRLNYRAGQEIFTRSKALLSSTPRLPDILGGSKMSKSSGNAIAIGSDAATLKTAVMKMYTDPGHLRVADPGQVEGNVVFSYLRAFAPDLAEVVDLETHYQKGGLGDMVLKKRLLEIMENELAPIREKRKDLDNNEGRKNAIEMLRTGTREARIKSKEILGLAREALGVFSF